MLGYLCFTGQPKPLGSLLGWRRTVGDLGSGKDLATVDRSAADAVDGCNLFCAYFAEYSLRWDWRGDTYSQLGGGLLRSSDGGQTWEHAPSNDLSGVGIFDIVVDPTNPLHVWVGTTDKLLESKNGGATWRTVQLATTWDISMNPKDPQEIFAATILGLVRSSNGAASWARIALPGSTPGSRFTRMEV